ncbi:hypothetical protein BC827DRAFT_1185607, partial [Russula dissimulans]
MSRLIVKNLPSYITPALLKEHFSQSKGPGGTITDVKVVLRQDGTARRFGFVGFKTDEEALKAKEWYDRSFIDSTRVKVEIIDVGILPCSTFAFRTMLSDLLTRVPKKHLPPDQINGCVWIRHLLVLDMMLPQLAEKRKHLATTQILLR